MSLTAVVARELSGAHMIAAIQMIVLVSYRLTLDTICIKKSHQIIAGTMVVAIRRSAAAVAARPALVK